MCQNEEQEKISENSFTGLFPIAMLISSCGVLVGYGKGVIQAEVLKKFPLFKINQSATV